jgi:hypothetical protein
MYWLFLGFSIYALIVGLLMVKFKERLGRYFYSFEGTLKERFLLPRWGERWQFKSEFDAANYYYHWGIGVIVTGAVILVLSIVLLLI